MPANCPGWPCSISSVSGNGLASPWPRIPVCKRPKVFDPEMLVAQQVFCFTSGGVFADRGVSGKNFERAKINHGGNLALSHCYPWKFLQRAQILRRL